MALEVGEQIGDLDASNPPGTDPLSQADDHLRLLKTCVQGSLGDMLELWAIRTNDTPVRERNFADDGYLEMISLTVDDQVSIAQGVMLAELGIVILKADVEIDGDISVETATPTISFVDTDLSLAQILTSNGDIRYKVDENETVLSSLHRWDVDGNNSVMTLDVDNLPVNAELKVHEAVSINNAMLTVGGPIKINTGSSVSIVEGEAVVHASGQRGLTLQGKGSDDDLRIRNGDGLNILTVATGTNNATFLSLAGTGSRAVVVDEFGTLSAP